VWGVGGEPNSVEAQYYNPKSKIQNPLLRNS
jgi:hypothetical protein